MPQNTNRIRDQVQITRVSVHRDAGNLIIKLPLDTVECLNLRDNAASLFAIPVNGVVQLSSFMPNVSIPVDHITEDDFE